MSSAGRIDPDDVKLSGAVSLRGFQPEAVLSALRILVGDPPEGSKAPATLLVQATGTGKTVCAIAVIVEFLRLFPLLKVLWVVGRRVLVKMAYDELQDTVRALGLPLRVGIEMGEKYAIASGLIEDQIVVASVESLHEKRRKRFDPARFSLMVVDECHNGINKPSYHKVYSYFEVVPRLGLTATPFDAAGNALGEHWTSVAFTWSLTSAINAGDLVPLRCQSIPIDSIEISGVDFNREELTEEEIEKVEAAYCREENLHKMARVIVDEVPTPAILFCATTGHSRALTAVLNRYDEGRICKHVDCYLDERVKAAIYMGPESEFVRGDLPYLANYGLLFEGFNAPRTLAVVFCCKTNKLRWAQGIGRVTRWCCKGALFERRCTCGAGKTEGLVLDFFGQAKKHEVSGIWEALAPGATPEMIERMQAAAEAHPERPATEIVAEVEEWAALHQVKAAAADVVIEEVDILDPLDDLKRRAWLAAGIRLPPPSGEMASRAQVAAIADALFNKRETKLRAGPWLSALSSGQADYMLRALELRKRRGLAAPLDVLPLVWATREEGGGRVPRYAPEVVRSLPAAEVLALLEDLKRSWR